MSHTYKRTRSEDKPKTKYKRKDKKSKRIIKPANTSSEDTQDWGFSSDVDASDF